MRKLKLQMQLTVDGFVGGPNGEMDWMNMNWGDDIKDYVKSLTAPVDCIVMGRKLAQGFIPYWTSYSQNPATADEFSHKMVDTVKVVFSKTLAASEWDNTELATGGLAEEITKLKAQDGGDIITYGGAGFASALIKEGLIDEYHIFINPAAIGKGITIFAGLESRLNLQLVKAREFECGVVLLFYKPVNG